MRRQTRNVMVRLSEQEYARATHAWRDEHGWLPFATWLRKRFLETLPADGPGLMKGKRK